MILLFHDTDSTGLCGEVGYWNRVVIIMIVSVLLKLGNAGENVPQHPNRKRRCCSSMLGWILS